MVRKGQPKTIQDYYQKIDQIIAHAISNSSGCLELHERLDTDGYPVLHICDQGKYRVEKIARLLIYRKYGEIVFSQGIVTRHRCHNRACVNIDHLGYGTRRDNARDMSLAGRSIAGKRIRWHERLDTAVLQVIAHEYDPIARNGGKLAARYGITRQRLHQIVIQYAPQKKKKVI